ncbi:hypothetical protein P8605_34390 [Streptomyces sp. T-3]|nr:hypothetical protein [Streptomyces sp. T-3]
MGKFARGTAGATLAVGLLLGGGGAATAGTGSQPVAQSPEFGAQAAITCGLAGGGVRAKSDLSVKSAYYADSRTVGYMESRDTAPLRATSWGEDSVNYCRNRYGNLWYHVRTSAGVNGWVYSGSVNRI